MENATFDTIFAFINFIFDFDFFLYIFMPKANELAAAQWKAIYAWIKIVYYLPAIHIQYIHICQTPFAIYIPFPHPDPRILRSSHQQTVAKRQQKKRRVETLFCCCRNLFNKKQSISYMLHIFHAYFTSN